SHGVSLDIPGQKNVPSEDSTGCTKVWPHLPPPEGDVGGDGRGGPADITAGDDEAHQRRDLPDLLGRFRWLLYEFTGDRRTALAGCGRHRMFAALDLWPSVGGPTGLRLDRPSWGDATPTTRPVIDWLFRNRETGRITIAQFPNAALGVFLAASLLRRLLDPGG